MNQPPIFIPTYGRSGKQVTFEQTKHLRPVLVVQERERHLYGRFPDVLTLPDDIRTVTPTRQWILEYAHKHELGKIVMMDDDLRFFKRKEPTANTKLAFSLLNATRDEVTEMVELLCRWLDEVAHCGISSREGNNRVEKEVVEATRMMRVLAYRVPTVMQIGARFDRLPLQEDFDMTLQLLRAGYPNRISYLYGNGQATGSGAKGGCSHFRTKPMMEETAHKLAELHPGFVNVVKKTTKHSFDGGERTDVMIAWKKALASARPATAPESSSHA